jgi:uncharacterized iron-regulated protein
MKIILGMLVLSFFMSGCTSSPLGPTHVNDVGLLVREDVDIIEPVSGNSVGWSELMFQIQESDIVLLGELHDHAVGHAVQLAVVEDVMDAHPNSVLALEMLERDEQILIDDYMEGFIDEETFERLTNSTNWGSRGGWVAWYQPIINAVKRRGGSVVGANAPRRYVRLARTDGYERIDELTESRRGYIDYPKELSGGRYRQRFWELGKTMRGNEENDENSPIIDVSEIEPNDPMLPVFRSQQAWDATMAQSIVNAKPGENRKVILLVGQFHVEYDGGIVQELRNRIPEATVLVISIQREIPEEEWRGSPPIADFMIVEKRF